MLVKFDDPITLRIVDVIGKHGGAGFLYLTRRQKLTHPVTIIDVVSEDQC